VGVSPRFLADACAIIDFFLEPTGSMTHAGNAAMAALPAISPITVWELTRKASLGKLRPLPMVRGRFAGYLANKGLPSLPLTWADAERANALPPIHKDPMDRMLIAQALNTGLTIITIDGLFAQYGVRTVW
jgi:PIN domain nuclease of toxin-antitoxin system